MDSPLQTNRDQRHSMTKLCTILLRSKESDCRFKPQKDGAQEDTVSDQAP